MDEQAASAGDKLQQVIERAWIALLSDDYDELCLWLGSSDTFGALRKWDHLRGRALKTSSRDMLAKNLERALLDLDGPPGAASPS